MPLHYHIQRAYAYSFNEGNLFPRWAGILDGGRGDALFTFYPPLAYLPGAFFMKFAGVDPLTSLKITTVLMLFLAQASAYCFGRAFFPLKGGLIVSLFYVLFPGFPLIGIKLSFFANAFALSLAPFAFRGAYDLLMGIKPRRGLMILALGMSGVILSHVITTYLCGIVLLILTLVSLPQAGWRGLARLAGAGALVFALTAFFLVPLKLELGWVRNDLQVGRHDYHDYFLFSKPKDQTRYRATWAKINDSASTMTIIQTIIPFLFCGFYLPLYRSRLNRLVPLLVGCSIAAFTILISIPSSDIIWRSIPGLENIQFPWRLLPLISLGSGLAAASVFMAKNELARQSMLRYRLLRSGLILTLFCTGVVGLLFTSALVCFSPENPTHDQVRSLLQSTDIPKQPFEKRADLDELEDFAAVKYRANAYFYRPKTADLDLYPPAEKPKGITFLNGTGRLVQEKLGNQSRSFEIISDHPTQIRLDTYSYPHWVLRFDGEKIVNQPELGTGLMLIQSPAGRHLLEITYESQMKLDVWAGWISSITWGLLLSAALLSALRETCKAAYSLSTHPSRLHTIP